MAFGDVDRSETAPGSASGIGGDANTIWYCENDSNDVYELSTTDLSTVRSDNSPNAGGDSGIGGDANTIWYCNLNTDLIYELDTSDFSTVSSDSSPAGTPSGVGGNANTIWHCDQNDNIYELDVSDFSTISTETGPSTKPGGIGGDTDTIWECDSDDDDIYELDISDFSTLRSVAGPSSGAFGIGGDTLTCWFCDFNTDLNYEIDIANNPPTAPTSLLCEEKTNPSDVTDLSPEFSAVYNDPDSDDLTNAYEIHLATTEAGIDSPDKWNSGWVAITVSEGNRSADITYAGSSLAINDTYYWKIRFRDDDNNEGAWSAVANFTTRFFENWAEKQSLFLERRFIYDDVQEATRVQNYGTVSRISDQIVSGGVSLTLINTDGYWNKFLSDKSNLRREAKLQMGIGVRATIARAGIARAGVTIANLVSLMEGSTTRSDVFVRGLGEFINIFTGWADDPVYSRGLVSISLRDKFAGLDEKELGSDESPIDYYSSSYNPADLAWNVLVTHGGLDSTASTSNTDIDYTSWSAWKTACTTGNLSLEAKFTGQKIMSALELIRDLTNSDIFVAGDGKIKFYRFLVETIPEDVFHYNGDFYDDFSVRLDSEKIINYVDVYYDYNTTGESWAGNYLAQDSDSQQEPPDGYGLSSETISGTTVWHATSASAAAYADRRVAEFKEPIETVSFRSFMMGMSSEIGDVIQVSNPLLDYAGEHFRVRKITALEMSEGTVNLEAGIFQQFTFTDIDLMEYSTDALAQAAYVSSLDPSPVPQLWSRLESADDVTTPQIGTGGDLAGAPNFDPVKYGNGIYNFVNGIGARFPTASNNINVDKGTIEFWASLYFLPTTDVHHYFFSFRSEGTGLIENLLQNIFYGLHDSASTRAAQKISLTGDTLEQISWYIARRDNPSTGESPTGTIYARVRRVSNDSIIETSSRTVDITTISDVHHWEDFPFTCAPDEEVYLSIEFSGGDHNRFLLFYCIDTNPISGVSYEYSDSTWAELFGSEYDLTIKIHFSTFARAGGYFFFDHIANELSVRIMSGGAGSERIYSSGFSYVRYSIHHFAITWDRTGTDIGSGKTLVMKVDDVEEANSTGTWSTDSTFNPYLYIGTDRTQQQNLYGGFDNLKTYNVCKTDFSDKDVEDPSKLQCYSESVIRQQGLYSLKIFARDTDSLNGTFTRTVSPTIDLSDLIEIRFEVRASRTGSNFKISIRDSGGTTTEHTVAIVTADTWQTEKWSILGLANANKDAIDRIIITITNASAANTIYIDKMQAFD